MPIASQSTVPSQEKQCSDLAATVHTRTVTRETKRIHVAHAKQIPPRKADQKRFISWRPHDKNVRHGVICKATAVS